MGSGVPEAAIELVMNGGPIPSGEERVTGKGDAGLCVRSRFFGGCSCS